MRSNGTSSGKPGSGTGEGGFIPPSTGDLDAVFANYEFIDLLGRGGMGVVYKARQKSLDRLVAIKILPPQLTTDAEEQGFHFAERFQREAKAMARLNHPNIIGVYDFGQASDGQFYFVMEYIEGTDLHTLIQSGQLTTGHVAGWMSQICDALQYAHAKGIVHRDIKPSNIMITHEGQVKVADFGLAKLTSGGEVESKLTMTNMAMGTPDYVAPEALEMGVEVDHRADLYAVGVMLYEMLTGKVPRGAWKSPSTQIPGLDPRYDALIERAMDADREERHQQASEISATIYEISATPAKPPGGRRTLLVGDAVPTGLVKPSASSSIPGPETPSTKGRSSSHTPSPPARKAKRSVGLIAGLAIGAVAVGLGLFFLFKSESDPPPESVVAKPEPVIPAASAPQPATPAGTTQAPAGTQADHAPMLVPPKEEAVVSVPISAPAAEAKTLFSDWTLRHSAPSGTDWSTTGNEISSNKKTTLWSPGEHGDFELELEWKVGPRGNGGLFYHVVDWNELEALEFQLADPANAGPTPTGGIYGIDLPVTDRSKLVGEWNTAKLLVRGSQREHWINGEKVLSYDVDSRDFRDRLGRTTLKTPLNIAARSGRLVLKANAGGISYRNLRLTPPTTPPAVTASAAPALTSGDPTGITGWSDGMPPLKDALEKHNKGTVEPDGAVSMARGEQAICLIRPRIADVAVRGRYATKTEGALELGLRGNQNTGLRVWLGTNRGQIIYVPQRDPGKMERQPLTEFTLPDALEHRYLVAVAGKVLRIWVDDQLVTEFPLPDSIPEPAGGAVIVHFFKGELVVHELETAEIPTHFTSLPLTPSTPTVMAAAPVTSATSAVPTPPLLDDPRVAQLDAGFQARYQADAEKPYLAALAALDQSYVTNGIARARAAAQQAGKFDEVTALDAEKARIESGEGVPPADVGGTPGVLIALRETYRKTAAQHQAAHDRAAAPLYDKYVVALDAYIAELTKANAIDQATAIKTFRETIAAPLLGKYLAALDAHVMELTKAGKLDEAKAVKARRDQLALSQLTAVAPAGTAVPATGAPTISLFDGKTLDGWRGAPDLSAFSVQDGAIRIGGSRAMLYYTGGSGVWPDFGDFELTMQVKTEDQANSGVYVHCRPKPEGGTGYDLGLEFQIANENRDPQKTGSLYAIEPVDRMPARDGQWFEYRIAVSGKTATAYVDGRKVVKWTEPDNWVPPPRQPTARIGRGSFALQATVDGTVWIKDIRLKVPTTPLNPLQP